MALHGSAHANLVPILSKYHAEMLKCALFSRSSSAMAANLSPASLRRTLGIAVDI